MADDSLTERNPAFNQLSLSSAAFPAAFRHSERVANLELASSLLRKTKAMITVAAPQGLQECSQAERQYYLAVIAELVEGALEQVEEAYDALHLEPNK